MVHVNDNHWVLLHADLRHTASDRCINVYDSWMDKDDTKLQHTLEPMLAKLFRAGLERPVRIHRPQTQKDATSCGLFAAAWSCLLTHGHDPYSVKLDAGGLRAWLNGGLERDQFDMPPIVHGGTLSL